MGEQAEGSAGFVYILINHSFPGMIKIGLTRNTSGDRASQLSRHTGIPTDFIVIYDELVADCQAVESLLHERFAGQRVNDRREFFRVSPREAIVALQEVARSSPIKRSSEAIRVDILAQFEARCRRWLRRDLVGLAVVQFPDLVLLEEAYQSSLDSSTIAIERTDMDFIDDGEDSDYHSYFSPEFSPEENARRFLSLDTNSLMHCFSLFNSEAYEWANRFVRGRDIPFSPPFV